MTPPEAAGDDGPDPVDGAVLRVWRGAAQAGDVPAYLRHLRDRVEPALRQLEGYLGVVAVTRPAGALVEIVVMTRWRSLEAIAAFASPDLEAAVVEPDAQAVLAECDTFARHFTVAFEAACE